MNLFRKYLRGLRGRHFRLQVLDRKLFILAEPRRVTISPVAHILWNILSGYMSCNIDRFAAQVEGRVVVLGFAVGLDASIGSAGTVDVTVDIETPLFSLVLSCGIARAKD